MPPHSLFSSDSVLSGSPHTALLDCARELFVTLSGDGILLQANAISKSVLGVEPEDIVGRHITEFLHAEDLPELERGLLHAAEKPESVPQGHCRLRNRAGDWRWCEWTARRCPSDRDGNRLVITFLDVTSLHRVEAERQVLSEVVHALNKTANLDQLLSSIHQALKKVVYAENCFVALHDTAQDTFSFPFFADQFDSAPASTKVGRSCTAYIFRTGRGMLIPQAEFDRLAQVGEVELVGSPSPSWLGVPLKTPTATIGVLVVQHYQIENAYDARDVEFLDSVGGHIALAIERRRSEEAVRKSESVFRLLFSHNPLPTWVVDKETARFIQANDAAVRLYGYTAEEFLQVSLKDIQAESQSDEVDHPSHESSETLHGTTRHRKKDGTAFEVELSSHELEYAGRRVRLVVAQDVSERRVLEQQLRQAQKMEAVGRLAGGVAHDFNNLLMVIKGHTELLMNELPPAERPSRKIAQIDRAADRAASLTRQLLAFSRMQVLQPRVISLNGIIEDLGKLLPRLIGEDIELVLRPAAGLGTIRADASQMEQILMNLAVNSRDAMPNGGKLLIETSNADLDRTYNASHPIVKPGRYVLLAVTDTGTGMDAETQAHIFEPFFTTKEPGKGTGLGLATVYGVVKQSGGFIWVYSEVGKGTSFKIYLPRVDQPEDKSGAPLVISEAPRGTETVLLAEDEQDVREVAREFLESGGYTVLEAHNGAEALQLAASHKAGIDLLVTDMVMPGMTGRELARRLQNAHAGLGVVYMSGYTEHSAAENFGRDTNIRLLTKPFSRGSILRAVRETINLSRAI